MHRIKRMAHVHACDVKDSRFNPFARRRTTLTLLDEEQLVENGNSQKDNSGTDSEKAVQTSRDVPSDGKPRKRLAFWKEEKQQPVGPGVTITRTHSTTAPKFTLWSQLRATIFGSWINVLLVCVPVGIALNYAGVNPLAVFIINFIAIVPLAGMLSYATEEIALRVGETLGGLLNATFGNAVEVIVSIIALVKDEILIVQTSLIGSMLSNLLLVMGMCFFFGGLRREEQFFNITVAQTAASLLALAIGALIIPTAFREWSNAGGKHTAELSRGTSVILLFVYGTYLFFQLKTHAAMYNEPSKKVAKRRSSKVKEGAVGEALAKNAANHSLGVIDDTNVGPQVEENGEDDDEEEVPQLSVMTAIITLCVSTALVGLCAEYMVGSISAVTVQYSISPEFVGLILIPIVGNAAEHATAVTVAIKDKMDLAIGVAVGSSMQIALFVLPLTVIIGWIVTATKGTSAMTLVFDGFQIAVLFVAVLLVNYLIQDGKSHWLEGVMLMSLYIIIAVAAWYYPANGNVVG